VVRRRVVVRGHVQGVFFRASCAAAAQASGVAGWVANQPDGTVEAVFEGAPESVDHMIAWCRKGPPRASVQRVEVTKEEPRGESGFETR
jgi:acylphosphatase